METVFAMGEGHELITEVVHDVFVDRIARNEFFILHTDPHAWPF